MSELKDCGIDKRAFARENAICCLDRYVHFVHIHIFIYMCMPYLPPVAPTYL